MSLSDCGIDPKGLKHLIAKHVYTLPGTDQQRETFTILLTGSRATGTHTPQSDVDLDVLCPQSVYDSVLAASYRAGLTKSSASFYRHIDDAPRYLGGRPAQFSLTSLDRVADQFRNYEDVPLWIWTNAKVVVDPGDQFQRILSSFRGYPSEVLVRKMKYRSLLSDYWAIDVYPHSQKRDDYLLAAATALTNSLTELLRLFFLVDGRPFPYAEHLLALSAQTTLGARFAPMLQHASHLIVGRECADEQLWTRLDRAFEMLECADTNQDAAGLQEACAAAMIAAGVEPEWVEADYYHIDELLNGMLGPPP